MKFFVVTIALIVLSCSLFSCYEAAPERQKRGLEYEHCPKGSREECLAYAEGQSKTRKYCHDFDIYGAGTIEWRSCGTISCETENENWKKIPEDLSKPYPDCCANCGRPS